MSRGVHPTGGYGAAAGGDCVAPIRTSSADLPLPIIQYWHSDDVPEYIENLFATFAANNPDRPHLIFNEASAGGFIERNLGAREFAAFQACAVPAMQADYFRCCAVLVLGGVYADADLHCVSPLGPLVDAHSGGELFGWRKLPPCWSEAVFGDAPPVGPHRFIENGFFAFAAGGHPFLRLALQIATANIEVRLAESVLLTTGPGVFTSMYLLHELGSFESFVRHASRGLFKPAARLLCEVVNDYATIARAFEEVRISPVQSSREWAHTARPMPYKRTSAHWPRWEGSIFR